jgi:hypothetical protein
VERDKELRLPVLPGVLPGGSFKAPLDDSQVSTLPLVKK